MPLALLVALLMVCGCAIQNNDPDPLWEKARAVRGTESQPELQPVKEPPEKTAQGKPAGKAEAQKPPGGAGGNQSQEYQREAAAKKAEAPQDNATDFSLEFKSRFRQEMLGYINEARKEAGVKALEYCLEADVVAEARAADMVKRRYFSHTPPEGPNFRGLLTDAGLLGKHFTGSGENILQTGSTDYARLCKQCHDHFMNSPGHRENVLDPRYSDMSIGVAKGHLDDPGSGATVVQIFLIRAAAQ
ncbi:MAG: CAP domain-containing protein [Firmicutes bacterium]|nr:CAP domain-containing protein [Bacillota bacterium]